jgi:hypothetical protein
LAERVIGNGGFTDWVVGFCHTSRVGWGSLNQKNAKIGVLNKGRKKMDFFYNFSQLEWLNESIFSINLNLSRLEFTDLSLQT